MQITTARLDLRPVAREDWRALQRIALDFQASKYKFYDRRMPTDDQGIRAVAEFAAARAWFAVRRRGEDEMLGYICLHRVKDAWDLGYCFHSSAQGQGYAFESIRGVLIWMEKIAGATKFTAGTALDNLPSVKLLEKLGFTKVDEETLSFWQDDQGRDISFRGGLYQRRIE